MPQIDGLSALLAAALTGLLAWAAISDIRTRKIPNRTVVAILILFVAWAVAQRADPLLSVAAAGAIAFAVGFGLYAAGMIGAGDAKLFAATALFTGLTMLPFLAVATALAGGVMGVVSVASRPRRALTMLVLKGQGDYGRGIPYGVAIAFGGATAVWLRIYGFEHPLAELISPR